LGELNGLSEGTTARFLFPSSGGNAEGYISRPHGNGPFPLMVLLHGHSLVGRGAKQVLPAAATFATDVCYASLAVSLPGYGDTEITGGPTAEATRQVVLDAVALAKRLPWVDTKRLYVYGFSRGAVVAAALINQLDGLKGALFLSGAYDLPRLYQDTSSFWLRRLLNPNGAPEPKLFNLLAEAEKWQSSTLILHGAKDMLVPVSQATSLRDRLASLGKPHRLVLFPEHGHWLPIREIKDQAITFLKENGGSACSASDP
jgi:dipeptidyl aminopeptidase/acylaminoacyl peptidase